MNGHRGGGQLAGPPGTRGDPVGADGGDEDGPVVPGGLVRHLLGGYMRRYFFPTEPVMRASHHDLVAERLIDSEVRVLTILAVFEPFLSIFQDIPLRYNTVIDGSKRCCISQNGFL